MPATTELTDTAAVKSFIESNKDAVVAILFAKDKEAGEFKKFESWSERQQGLIIGYTTN